MTASDAKQILIVEKDLYWRTALRQNLAAVKFKINPEFVNTAEEAIALLKHNDKYELIIADMAANGSASAMELWNFSREKHSKIPFVLISDQEDVELTGAELEVPMFVPKRDLHLSLKHGLVERLISGTWNDLELDSMVVPSDASKKSKKAAARGLTMREVIFIIVLIAVVVGAYYAPKRPMMSAVQNAPKAEK
jgi:CheY-like chemotaxis protein